MSSFQLDREPLNPGFSHFTSGLRRLLGGERFGGPDLRRGTELGELFHPRSHVAPLMRFGQAAGLLRLELFDLAADALDHTRAVCLCARRKDEIRSLYFF